MVVGNVGGSILDYASSKGMEDVEGGQEKKKKKKTDRQTSKHLAQFEWNLCERCS